MRRLVSVLAIACCYAGCSTFPDALEDEGGGGSAGSAAGSSGEGGSTTGSGGTQSGGASGGGSAGSANGGSATGGSGTGAQGGAAGGSGGTSGGGQGGAGGTGGTGAAAGTGGQAGSGGSAGAGGSAGGGGTGGIVSVSVVAENAVWKYYDKGAIPASNWFTSAYSDAAWDSGPAKLGYGDADVSTVVDFGPNASNKYVTTYFRKTIQISNTPIAVSAAVRYDDGVLIRLDGTEVFRGNLRSGAIGYGTLANTIIENTQEGVWHSVDINPVSLPPGTHTIAAEVHQAIANSSDLGFAFRLGIKHQN